MRRVLRILVVAVLGCGLPAVGPGPAGACACGAAISDARFESVEETALVELSGGREAITLNLAAETEATSAAFIMPVPARASFELADGELFAELDDVSKPRVVYREVERDGDGVGAAPPGDAGVQVADHVDVGPYEVAQLTGDDTQAVTSWLGEQDFALSPDLKERLTPYLAEGWFVVAVHLTPENVDTFDGGLPPMRVAFPTEEPVYPMRLSAAADHAQPLRLYILADHRMDVTNPAPDGREPELTFAGRLTPADVEDRPTLAGLVDRPRFLTRYDARFDPADITDDIHLTRSATDDAYRGEVTKMRFVDAEPHDGIVTGDAETMAILVAVASAAAVAAVVTVVVVRSRRGDRR